jgi:hypothetical protein
MPLINHKSKTKLFGAHKFFFFWLMKSSNMLSLGKNPPMVVRMCCPGLYVLCLGSWYQPQSPLRCFGGELLMVDHSLLSTSSHTKKKTKPSELKLEGNGLTEPGRPSPCRLPQTPSSFLFPGKIKV